MVISARKELLENIRQNTNEENNFRMKMDPIQKRVKFREIFKILEISLLSFQLHCCGIDEYRDWFKADTWVEQVFVPDSCCIEEQFSCGKRISANETYGLIYTDVSLVKQMFD